MKVALAVPPARAISNDLWDALQERYPEFSKAVLEGHMLAEAWCMKQGRRALFLPEGVRFNAITHVFRITNRFANYRRNPGPPVSLSAPAESVTKSFENR